MDGIANGETKPKKFSFGNKVLRWELECDNGVPPAHTEGYSWGGRGADLAQDRQTRSPREAARMRGINDRPTVPNDSFRSCSTSGCAVKALEKFLENGQVLRYCGDV